MRPFPSMFFCILLLVSPLVYSIEKPAKLPDPLSLEFALSIAEENHPDISSIEYAIEIAQSQTAIAEAQSKLQLRAQARARIIDPPPSLTGFGRQDHQGKLLATKTLYDFGRTSNTIESMQAQKMISTLRLQHVKQLRRIQVMQAFFDVLLSDLTYLRDNEAMTMGFLQYDRAKERNELGQLSDVDVLEKENIYYERRTHRYNSESLQRLLRNQFSLVLDTPGDVVSRFEMPELTYHKFKLLDVKRLQQAAIANNLDLKITQLSLDVLRAQLKSLRSNRYPVISAVAEVGVYMRNIGGNDRWRAGLVLDVPIYQGGKVKHQISELKLNIKQLESRLYQEKLSVKQAILDHYLRIANLVAQKESSYKRFDYRELYLDRARAVYEMEVKSDLGDAEVQLSQASLQVAETDFEIAMRWEKLRLLTQMKIEEMRQ